MQDPIVALQRLLPQPWLARTFGKLARSESPWVRYLLIRLWIRVFDISLADAARPTADDYVSFEDFFTRELLPDARPQPADPRALVSPADGYLHEFGTISDGRLVQAKGIDYALGALLGDAGMAEPFRGGWYATIYLSPADYHRVHVPCDAVLRTTIAIPGQLRCSFAHYHCDPGAGVFRDGPHRAQLAGPLLPQRAAGLFARNRGRTNGPGHGGCHAGNRHRNRVAARAPTDQIFSDRSAQPRVQAWRGVWPLYPRLYLGSGFACSCSGTRTGTLKQTARRRRTNLGPVVCLVVVPPEGAHASSLQFGFDPLSNIRVGIGEALGIYRSVH